LISFCIYNLYAGSLGVFHFQTNTDQLAVFRPATRRWFFDLNNDGLNNGCPPDGCSVVFGATGDLPIAGNWNGTGKSDIGFFRPSNNRWYLDKNGNGVWNTCATDTCLAPFGTTGDIPVSGDWFGLDFTAIGVFRPSDGRWYLDNGNGKLESCLKDKCYGPFGQTGDKPVVGDWRGIGRSLIGVFRPSTHQFLLDWNANGKLDACTVDKCVNFGTNTDLPVAGDWLGLGKSRIGVFSPSSGLWFIDNGSFSWQGCLLEYCPGPFGKQDDLPFSGIW
jgi:hypothetical protein